MHIWKRKSPGVGRQKKKGWLNWAKDKYYDIYIFSNSYFRPSNEEQTIKLNRHDIQGKQQLIPKAT